MKVLCYTKETNHERPQVVWFHLYAMSEQGKFTEIKKKKIAECCLELGMEINGEWAESSFTGDRNILNLYCGVGFTLGKFTQNCALKRSAFYGM